MRVVKYSALIIIKRTDESCRRSDRAMKYARFRCRREACSGVARYRPLSIDDSPHTFCHDCLPDLARTLGSLGYHCVVEDLFTHKRYLVSVPNRRHSRAYN